MREMTLKEYLMWSITQNIAKEAEKEGIKIVEKKTEPRLITSQVIKFKDIPDGQS
jgi:hypothetical protein